MIKSNESFASRLKRDLEAAADDDHHQQQPLLRQPIKQIARSTSPGIKRNWAGNFRGQDQGEKDAAQDAWLGKTVESVH